MDRRQKYHPEQDLVWSIMQALGKFLTWPFRGSRPSARQARSRQISESDKALIQAKWCEVTELMRRGGPSHFRLAIMHADTALDGALKALNMSGNTMGERLKAANHHFQAQTYDMVWQAHRARNRLAHEMDSEVMSWEAREAVARFDLALREIGALKDDT